MFPGKAFTESDGAGDSQHRPRSLPRFLERLPVFWRLQFLGWGGLAIYTFLIRASFWDSYTVAFALTIVLEPAGVLISTGLRHFYRSLGLRREQYAKVIGIVIVASGLSALLLVKIGQLSNWALLKFQIDAVGGPPVGVRLVFFWMIFAAWSFAYLWFNAELAHRIEMTRSRSAAAAAQRAELEMLRLQLNPHFLFNSLNNIAAEIREHPTTAVEMTMQLADYLRYSLEHQDELVVPLGHEIEAMKNYLGIEKSRFTNRLSVTVEESGDVHRIMVPCFLLQPLVENGLKHGLTTSSPPWDIGVSLRKENSILHIRVHNTGLLSKNWQTGPRPGTGTGLTNLRRRLELHYPHRHTFTLHQENHQVVVEITLHGEPYRV